MLWEQLRILRNTVGELTKHGDSAQLSDKCNEHISVNIGIA